MLTVNQYKRRAPIFGARLFVFSADKAAGFAAGFITDN